MTDSSTQGIKTVLHPVSDLEAAKKVYTALLGIAPQADSAYYVGYERGSAHRAGAGRRTAGHDLAGGLLARAGHRGEAGRGDRGGRHREGARARRRWRPPGGHRHRHRRQRPRAAAGPMSATRRTGAERRATPSTGSAHDMDLWVASASADGRRTWCRCPSTGTARRCCWPRRRTARPAGTWPPPGPLGWRWAIPATCA